MPKATIWRNTTDPNRAPLKVRWREKDPDTGLLVARSESFTSERAAEKRVRELANADDEGTHIDNRRGRITLRAFVDEVSPGWIDIAPKTRDRHVADLRRHVYPTLGSTPIGEIDSERIQRVLTRIDRKLAPSGVRKIYGTLVRVFDDAIRDKRVKVSPCVEGIRLRPTVAKIAEILDGDEVEKLFLALPDDYAATAFVMGSEALRIGECLALQWRDVDLDARTIRVRESLVLDEEGKLAASTPKTASGTRVVPMRRRTANALRELRDRKDPAPRSLVFPAPRGGPYSPGNYRRRVFDPVVDALGFPITPHALRKTAISGWLDRAISVPVAALWAGHNDGGALILRTYAQARAASADAMSAALDALDEEDA